MTKRIIPEPDSPEELSRQLSISIIDRAIKHIKNDEMMQAFACMIELDAFAAMSSTPGYVLMFILASRLADKARDQNE